MIRCAWAADSEEIYIKYHDTEWGVPIHDDLKFFELLILEGAQAGLSWITILKRRDNYREAFDGFNPEIVADYDERKEVELLSNAGIIRNKLKIKSAIKNAKIFLLIQEEFGSFDKYIWEFVDGKQIQNNFVVKDIPAETELSKEISKDLKKRGMSFVGPTIIYAFMQSAGLVNDHDVSCFRHSEYLK